MKSKILKELKKTNNYLSGEELSAQLGVTRAAVWKAVNKLKEEGYTIESVTNKGYRLVQSPDVLTEEEILDGLSTRFIGHKVFYYPNTDSTISRARQEAEHGAPDGSIFIADTQTTGKGRLGRAWSSPAGVGIWMSVLLYPEAMPQEILPITLAIGLAVCRVLRQETGMDVRIKWPNDIVANGKKLCGLLTEMQAEAERIRLMVVSMGINVNNDAFPQELQQKATSLRLLTGKQFARKPLVQQILCQFEQYYDKLLNEGFAGMLEEYRTLCITLGREVCATVRGNTITGTATGITPSGDLLIETSEGVVTVTAGEVSVRGIYGYI